jgi:hypothetical protein
VMGLRCSADRRLGGSRGGRSVGMACRSGPSGRIGTGRGPAGRLTGDIAVGLCRGPDCHHQVC